MAVKVRGVFCAFCKKYVMAQANKPNHVLHLILSILFLPWLIVWVLISAGAIGNYRCTQCGRKV